MSTVSTSPRSTPVADAPLFAVEHRAIRLESVPCLLCCSDDYEPVQRGTDPFAGTGAEFQVVRCRRCSFAYTNPRPTVDQIGLFYPKDYGPYEGREAKTGVVAGLRFELEKAVLRSQYGYPPQPVSSAVRMQALFARLWINRSRQRQFWIPFRSPGSLLDFGCGAGEFLRRMKAFGWNVQGLDFSAEVAQEVTARLNVPVLVGTLPHPHVGPKSFDAVTMWNALEHVHDPRATVKAAREALAARGLLVVGVPNFASWSARHFREYWYGLQLPTHLSHFTPETLVRLLERENFRLLELKHVSRVGCLRKSARMATRASALSWWLRACRFKPLGLAISNWAERTGQADFMVAIAEKQG